MRAINELAFPALRRDFDRLFDNLWEASDWVQTTPTEWMPTVDLTEVNGSLVVHAECPGMEAKDVRLSIENGVLLLEGEKHAEHEEKDARMLRRERRYGAFVRRIPLPAPVDFAKVKAEFKNGLLTITMPKLAVAAEKRIPILTS